MYFDAFNNIVMLSMHISTIYAASQLKTSKAEFKANFFQTKV